MYSTNLVWHRTCYSEYGILTVLDMSEEVHCFTNSCLHCNGGASSGTLSESQCTGSALSAWPAQYACAYYVAELTP